MHKLASEILNFWFKESKPSQWFEKNITYDKLIKKKFLNYHESAVQGHYDSWQNTHSESLALIILIDQFSRNIFRENYNSYKYDYISLNVSKFGIKNLYLDKFEDLNKRLFFILPLIHSENIVDQNQAIELANNQLSKHHNFKKILKFFFRHKEIIQKFNRFPHRNKILSRESTEKEIAFLKTPFSSF